MSAPGAGAELMGRLAYHFSLIQPSLPTFAGLLLAALFPIYCGAHASLSLPSSAAEPTKKNKSHQQGKDESEEEDDEDDAQSEGNLSSSMSGLHPEDALWFPLIGGLFLGGLYLLIKWLEDPALLNKLLNGYFSILGIVSVGRLVGDSLSVAASFVFPQRWSNRSGVWHVQRGAREFVIEFHDAGQQQEQPQRKASPFPGWMSNVALPTSVRSTLWTIRGSLTDKFGLRISYHGRTLLRSRFGLTDVLGFLISLGALLVYNFVAQPWWLVNLLGFGMSYGALQLISPRTFWTGTMVLSSLFCYDIYMVFFTPLMVTVAKSLDVPIKLLIPRAPGPNEDPKRQQLAMLGLGDVVLPGIMVALALRFDLYLWYLRKQTERANRQATVSDTDEDQPVDRPKELVKATYRPATGRWGERFWTGSTHSGLKEEPGAFPKPYFRASIIGYVLGLIVTFGVLAASGHAQPALLYLVPGVLLALWGLASFKGEVTEMWEFVDATSDDADSSLKATTNETATSEPSTNAPKDTQASHGQDTPTNKSKSSSSSDSKSRNDHEVFSIAITRRPYPSSRTTRRLTIPDQSSIVQDIRNALDGDLHLRSSSASPIRRPGSAKEHAGKHGEKRPRLE